MIRDRHNAKLKFLPNYFMILIVAVLLSALYVAQIISFEVFCYGDCCIRTISYSQYWSIKNGIVHTENYHPINLYAICFRASFYKNTFSDNTVNIYHTQF